MKYFHFSVKMAKRKQFARFWNFARGRKSCGALMVSAQTV